ncbi:Spy/CpxP family protein refolding chaperone [Algibacter mikhailovii]|uniref:Periplasmic heavy metal sensor n=1 Tax=Algibacter mikhailovii TaxID=425498 RepID=A0A918R1G4_9FLAO|nr:periplasmic heavy metal sensor [Algibacter mikhailovii]GGZ82815.1 hypothetical protein GCM10007028_20820 [Algibacter mikhailovii]
MKNKLPLYLLLFFLIIVNAFFLYNYLGAGDQGGPKDQIRPGDFLVKELGLDATQQAAFRTLGREHHRKMRGLLDDIKELKDALFKGLSDDPSHQVNVDSIVHLIGEKEAAKDLEVFRHFKKVQALCNAKQKEKFAKIIEDGLRVGGRDQGPRGARPEGERGPRSKGFEDNRPPRPNGPNANRPPPAARE